jgi:hypothetical protein
VTPHPFGCDFSYRERSRYDDPGQVFGERVEGAVGRSTDRRFATSPGARAGRRRARERDSFGAVAAETSGFRSDSPDYADISWTALGSDLESLEAVLKRLNASERFVKRERIDAKREMNTR